MANEIEGKNRTSGFPFVWKILLMLCGAVILMALLFILFSHFNRINHFNHQKFITGLLRRELNEFIVSTKNSANLLARNKYVIQRVENHPELTVDEEMNTEVSAVLYSVKMIARASIAYIMNKDGYVIASTTYDGQHSLKGNIYRFRPYFSQAITGKHTIYAALCVTTNERGLYFSAPIIPPGNQEPLGVAIIKIGVGEIDIRLHEVPFAAGIMSEDGIIFAANREKWLFQNALPISNKRRHQLEENRQFGKHELKVFPAVLDKEIVSMDDSTFGLVREDLSIPGWKVFSLKPLSPKQVMIWSILVLAGLLLIIHVIGLAWVNNRKKLVFEQEKNLAQEEIRNQNEFLYTILNSLSYPFYIVNLKDYTVALANKAAGFEFSSISERPYCYEITHHRMSPCATVPPYHKCPIDEIKKSKKPVLLEHRLKDKNGKTRYHEIHAYPIFDDSGKLVQMIEYNVDITHRKELEMELLKSQQLESIGILAGGIAHDFNNMLSVIIGNIELVKDELSPKDRNHTFLENAEKNALKAAELSRKLISFSRGGWLQRKKIYMESLINEIIEAKFSDRHFPFQLNFEKDLYTVYGDERQLNQVFFNVIQNAIEASSQPELNPIEIKGENLDSKHPEIQEKLYPLYPEEYGYVKISIKDHGNGIKKENMNKIFDPYFSTKNNTDQKGLGLGLTLCYSIVKKHCGLISLESEPGTGTTVQIFLPEFSCSCQKKKKG